MNLTDKQIQLWKELMRLFDEFSQRWPDLTLQQFSEAIKSVADQFPGEGVGLQEWTDRIWAELQKRYDQTETEK